MKCNVKIDSSLPDHFLPYINISLWCWMYICTVNNQNIYPMKTVYHKADSRGHADHGWLNSYHTFSFANYQNRDRSNFGVLRVLNDDTVSQGMGFGTHPHKNMEIISIPLEGNLEHKDSMGTTAVIRKGEIQVMSAGTGVMHSEYNQNKDEAVKFLQIWVFPKEEDVEPRYDQKSIREGQKINGFQQILSPHKNDDGVWIHQDAWFNVANFTKGNGKNYTINKKGNGVYAFLLKGCAKVGDRILHEKDGLGIWDAQSFNIEAIEDTEILLMEVPMELPAYLK